MRNQRNEEQRVEAAVKEMAQRLGMADWLTLDLKWDTTTDKELDADLKRVVCVTKTDWEYRQASLLWNLHYTAGMEDQEFRDLVIHELVHVLTACLWNEVAEKDRTKLEKLNELATENVARALTHCLDTLPYPD